MSNWPEPLHGRVLLVDDDPLVLRITQDLLEELGYDVTATTDPTESLVDVSTGLFDAVLADVVMPNMDGLELVRRVRQRDADLPVILVTASPTLGTAIDAVEAGAFRYLTKPLEPVTLRATLARAVRLSRLARVRHRLAARMGVDDLDGIGDRALAERFEAALESLWIAWQPIVSWSARSVLAWEALLRTRDPLLPSPREMLAAAERLGRMVDLADTVHRRIARDMEQAPDDARIFVNLHVSDLLGPALSSPDGPLARWADRTVLEITERASLQEVDDVEGRVEVLRRLGYRVAVDDLGAGYAGLSSFVALSPEVVKLDMALVRGVDRDTVRQELIRSMIGLCQSLGSILVAEGVETIEERDTLAELGCDVMQGYLFHRPGAAFPPPRWED